MASGKGLVVVTGASSGIGAAIARAFSEAGHPLLLLARRVEPMAALGLPNTMCEPVDVVELASFEAAVAKAEEAFGPTVCLVNNAGVMLLGKFADQDPAEWDTMINVNIKGVLHGCKAVLAGMLERKSGTIINISSIAGRKTFPSHSVYCLTKAGVHFVTEAIREEAASSGVRCVVIAPGVVETPLLSHTTSDSIKKSYAEWKADGLKGTPLLPEDVADSCLFAFNLPPRACVRELVLGPTFQEQ